ncbi:hypothetical protein EV1_005105 [Malus domestica]
METEMVVPNVTPAASSVLLLTGVLAETKIPVTTKIGMGLLLLPLSNHGSAHLLRFTGLARVVSLVAPLLACWIPALGAQLAPLHNIVLLSAHIVMAAPTSSLPLRALRWSTIQIPPLGFLTPALPIT